MAPVSDILAGRELSRQDIIQLLSVTQKSDHAELINQAYSIKSRTVGEKAYLRGLIEFSNQCRKNCLYCGIRSGNTRIERYTLSDDDVLDALDFASSNHFSSIVLQSGELNSKHFTNRITTLITKIKKRTSTEFRITLSLGEQSPETYQQWFDAGAQRYLLRIETSSEELYKKIHPADERHKFDDRLKCLDHIQHVGYQTGTGVMIGLPFQTVENLADDLLFIKHRDIDMVGMGPYLEHTNTPLYQHAALLMPLRERFDLSLRMIAVLRILMPTINIASTTALQSIFPMGREMGLKAGANVLMPNLTPIKYRNSYLLYENKPCIDEETDDCLKCLTNRVKIIGEEIAFNDYGDSKHFSKRQQKKK